ncbi:MAG: hypothetical protein G01um101418_178 [Parcubacteria group bacterium Gr01-1014_18]|nr:MAG: hypothetical protein Greene041636_146 [Parcubacteria group bacterium Greene0416_36]TSC81338.1 MAG: hypothetical protein G01um101418_178 [Parcubacteria group bacterium Gr01-1014_18]TSC99476.1 MAG: hypothetical protein Greene101420_143 [Parcubacteria group bacterium Greene1014_20]TSD07605.1 MAG: hypothetical protein Greene07142_62 [Parcubacteria group bacterium Greene0714_2]
MGGNYDSWLIDIESFPADKSWEERIKFLIGFAVLAPSSHNSQPWVFKIRENELFINFEASRDLPGSDPGGRQAWTSIGCAMENLCISSSFYGLSYKIEYFFVGTEEPFVKVIFELAKNNAVRPSRTLMQAMLNRRTNRGAYGRKIPLDFISDAAGFNSPACRIDFVSDPAGIEKIGEIVISSTIDAFRNPLFGQELSGYVKSNWTRAGAGIPGFALGIPAPISLLASFMVRRFNMGELGAKQDRQLYREGTPVWGMVSCSGDHRKDWVCAGMLYEKLALLATKKGLASAMQAAPVQVGEYWKSLQEVFRTSFRPLALFRLGYPSREARPTPRFSADQVLISR